MVLLVWGHSTLPSLLCQGLPQSHHRVLGNKLPVCSMGMEALGRDGGSSVSLATSWGATGH